MTKKQLKKEELGNATGGAGGYGLVIKCGSCQKDFEVYRAECRGSGSGCDHKSEAKCPNCGHWNEFNAG